MNEAWIRRAAFVGRWTVLLLLAGHLLFRREFAHRNLGELFTLLGATPPGFLARAYITEVCLLLLLPLAAFVAWAPRAPVDGPPVERPRPSLALTAILLFCGWGALHAAWAFFDRGTLTPHPVTGVEQPRSVYLILRQSALAAYPLFFVYAYVFFRERADDVRLAGVFGVAVAVLCGVLDLFGLLGPKWEAESRELLPIYGQETFPLAILALALLFADSVVRFYGLRAWIWRALALAGITFVGWRQAARNLQSVVPVGLAAAILLFTVFALVLALRRQTLTLRRAIVIVAFFGVVGFAFREYRAWRAAKISDLTRAPEVQAWKPEIYRDLFRVHEHTRMPAPPERHNSYREPYGPLNDEEAYKLQAVFNASPTPSVRNNVWRFLVWRRMLIDWRLGSPVLGRGVGRPWYYASMYHTNFHYGDPVEGLDPHNSYINILFRYGVVGLLCVVVAIGAVLARAGQALLRSGGDTWAEGALLYFIYTAAFAAFVVTLEGPSYSLPFWTALGLLHARSRQL